MIRYASSATVLTAVLFAATASAQTVIYDGSETLNFISSSRVTDDLALPLILQSGADPNVLENGDSAWFRSGGRRMRNTNTGLASTAVGADGDFMSHITVPADLTVLDPRAAGAAYILKDAKATTGRQLLNLSVFFNDPTPNNVDNSTSRNTGGNAAIRVYGVLNNPLTDPAVDPWESAFELVAGSGGSAANIAAGEYGRTGSGAPPVNDPTLVDSLLLYQSASGAQLLPSTDWQDLSLEFDAGAGYDWLVFGFGGAEMDGTNLPADRFAFDNISFETAPPLDGDYNDDGVVDAADYTVWRDGGSPDSSQAGYDLWEMNYGAGAISSGIAAPEPSTMLLGVIGLSSLAARRRRC